MAAVAVMVLSPWPTTPAALAAATGYLKAAIANDGEDDAIIQRVGAVASIAVEEYAPNAPAATRSEATIRFAGYLYGSDYGGIKAEELGPRKVEYETRHLAMFRYCGAAGLLTRWKRRRAGAIG